MTLRDLFELAALAIAIATVAVATRQVWPSLLATGAALGYLSHAWVLDTEVRLRRRKSDR